MSDEHMEEQTSVETSFLTEEELSEEIEILCLSKAKELQMLGYEQVTGTDVWNCISSKYKKKGIPPLHQLVNDILSLKAPAFMNWMLINAYKDL